MASVDFCQSLSLVEGPSNDRSVHTFTLCTMDSYFTTDIDPSWVEYKGTCETKSPTPPQTRRSSHIQIN